MKISVLAEDTSISPFYKSEHGLSFFIEANGIKILFDMGASSLFLENAEKLGLDIKNIDLAIISHGHYDHGGGLNAFLTENTKAKVYINKNAFGNHYSKRIEKLTYIGLDQSLEGNSRLIPVDDFLQINQELMLFSRVAGEEFLSSCNDSLFAEKDHTVERDDFVHEQNLVITEGNHSVLFAGCAHNGIVNILNRLTELGKLPPNHVIGGFHLYNHGKRTSENPANVSKIGEFLKETGSVYYTGHCTGTEAFQHLKKIMGNQVQYLSTGTVVEI